MKTPLLAVLTLCAGNAAALEGPVAAGNAAVSAVQLSTPPAAVRSSTHTAEPPFIAPPAVRLAAKDLALLLARGGEVPAERLGALLPQLDKFNAALEEALGPALLADSASQEARDALGQVRTALQRYYADSGGQYPDAPAALVPGYLPAIPELRVAGHGLTAKVTAIGSKKYDDEPDGALTDSGGWLYFSGEGSANRGLLLIDCSHKDPSGQEYSKY